MRLLNCRRLLEGHLASEAVESFYGDPPPYAILSHTWGKEEVSLHDLAQPDLSCKAGFKKISYCCEQSLKDNLEYAWVDTCCIDKSSSAELSEAINSMFRWYLKANVCYAYLQDVATTEPDDSGANPGFCASKWFTRGWTLQELLAPDTVIFYSVSWQKIGMKADLVDTLSQITNIDSVFFGPGADLRLRSASIAQKMSWAANRTTTRVEDIAYSLLGLFDISLPLLYGEGTRAFTRLQEELLKQYHDHSIFAWGLSGSGRRSGLLAASPTDFVGCEDIVPFKWSVDVPAPTRIPQGVQIHVHLSWRAYDKKPSMEDGEDSEEDEKDALLKYALLNCHMKHNLHEVFAIPLVPSDAASAHWRDEGVVSLLKPLSGRFQRLKPICVMDKSSGPARMDRFDDLRHHLSKGRRQPERLMWIQQLPKGYRVVDVLPAKSWHATKTIEMSWPWDKHTKDAKLVKIVDDESNRAVVVALTIRRSISFFGQFCPFASGRPTPSCMVAIVDNGQSLQDIADRMGSLEWQREPWVSGLGRVMVDIRRSTTMGWEMLAVHVYIARGVQVWPVRARKLITQLRSESTLYAVMDLILLSLPLFLLWLLTMLVRMLYLFCWSLLYYIL